MRKQYHDTHDPTLVSPSPESSGDYEPTIGMGQVASGTHLLWIPCQRPSQNLPLPLGYLQSKNLLGRLAIEVASHLLVGG